MNDSLPVWLAVLLLLATSLMALAEGSEPLSAKLLAAMPVLELSMTHLTIGAGSNDLLLSVSRAILPNVVVRGIASTSGLFDLHLRVLAPLQLAPAFLAIELSPTRVTGLMTLFFGPVSVDLGKTWFEPSRWALIQLVVHPRLTMVIGGIEQSDAITPCVGWRLFPTASAQWEIDMLFNGNEIRLSVGGIL
jgi:hypothetical protein